MGIILSHVGGEMEMVNVFARAGVLTLLILTAWFLLSTALEGDRNALLLGKIDTVISQESAIIAYLDYIESTGDTERYCSVLSDHIEQQNQKLFELLGLLDQTRENSLQNQYQTLRQRFQSANAQLYFSLKQLEQKCPETASTRIPILYFFPDNAPCTDCLVQAQVLNEIRDTCNTNVQIFAFPVEGGIETVDLLVGDYGITQTPSLVIDEKVYPGVQSKQKLSTLLECGA